MNIRKATLEDLDQLVALFDHGRQVMRQQGNNAQWIDGYPSRELLTDDINQGESYVFVGEKDNKEEIYASFYLTTDPDPTYQVIEGQWLNDAPYATIHRIVSSGRVKGAGIRCIQWVQSQFDNVRIDTHESNKLMRRILKRLCFKDCGVIYVDDGSPRIAFHYVKGGKQMEKLKLNNGVEIPQVGFGTWKLEEGKAAYEAVETALKAGYRHIDTAQIYKNEASIGRAIKDSGIPRDQLFVTTKSWNTHQTYEEVIDAFEESLEKLQMDYVDLFLLHWPTPENTRENEAWKEINAERWRALEELYRSNKVRAIGISNFMERHIEVLDQTAHIKPMINQILLAPGETQKDLVSYCQDRDILIEAYSPFGSGDLLTHPEVQSLAKEYNKTTSQIMLRWSLQHQFIPLPRSSNPQHIKENLDIFNFELSTEGMELLDNIVSDTKQRDPEEVSF